VTLDHSIGAEVRHYTHLIDGEWTTPGESIEAAEVGKPIRMARGDIDGAIGLTEYAATLAFDIHGEAYDNITCCAGTRLLVQSIFQEEIFGPVLVTARFSTVDEAIELANNTVYGLANAVWTKNLDRAIEVGRALRSGTVWINTANDGAPQLPFGGYRDSGSGREKGHAGLEEFFEEKTFHIHVGARTPALPER